MSPSRAPVFTCAHYFQAPATQAMSPCTRVAGTERHNFPHQLVTQMPQSIIAERVHLIPDLKIEVIGCIAR